MSLDPITGLENLAETALNKFVPDPNAKMQAQSQIDASQSATDTAEASNPDLFVSGWRPFIGWVCGFAFAYKFVIQPFLIFFILVCGVDFDPNKLPILDASDMSTILMGMLGLGTMRSFEKFKGVN